MFILFFEIHIILILTTLGQSTLNEVCLKNSRTEFKEVLELYNDPLGFFVPDEFETFKNLINRIKIIISKIKTAELEKTLNVTQIKQKIIRDEIGILQTGNNILNSIKENAKRLEELQKLHNMTEDECSLAKENYNKLLKDYQYLEKQSENVNMGIKVITTDVNEMNNKSNEIKLKLEGVKVSSDLSNKYLCEKKFLKHLKTLLTLPPELEIFSNNNEELTEKLKPFRLEKLPQISITKKQFLRDIKYFDKTYEKLVRLRDLIDQKNQAKLDLDEIEKIVFHLCRNGVCTIRETVNVED